MTNQAKRPQYEIIMNALTFQGKFYLELIVGPCLASSRKCQNVILAEKLDPFCALTIEFFNEGVVSPTLGKLRCGPN